MGRKPHLIAVPYAAQGHIGPMMKLAYNLVNHGIKVTFVNTESIHAKIMSSLPQKILEEHRLLSLVSIPQRLESDHDGTDGPEIAKDASGFLQSQLQNLIENINQLNMDEQVSHVIADISIGWALKLAKKMGIKPVGFLPYGVGNLALVLHIPKLIEDGIIDVNGIPIKEECVICLSKEIPVWNPKNLVWSFQGNQEVEKLVFVHFLRDVAENVKICNEILANSFYQLEPSACNLIPRILPIGPLRSSDHLGPFAGNILAEDSTCLSWLDQQPTGSVIYAAFGSSVVCSKEQVHELAIGFEIIDRPFLWVVRSDFTKGTVAEFPEGFIERIANYGKIVEWAPQEKVLAHPSTACFISHCGWNSTMEGVSMGVPFLCWPYGVDQFHNKDQICKAWKIGFGVIPDENGIVSRHQIKSMIEKLLSDHDIKANSLKLKELAEKSITEDGSSFKNFTSFIDQTKH